MTTPIRLPTNRVPSTVDLMVDTAAPDAVMYMSVFRASIWKIVFIDIRPAGRHCSVLKYDQRGIHRKLGQVELVSQTHQSNRD
jgi:hypothetical protein